jgi:PPOX class probable F420-dependent enzyme
MPVELPEPARELLQKKAWGHVITRNKNGSPQVTLVWVGEDNGDLVFNTSMQRQKAINLQQDPRVVVSVQNIESPQQYLVVRGRAELDTARGPEHINELSQKMSGRDYNIREGEERVMVRVRADRISGAGPWIQQG